MDLVALHHELFGEDPEHTPEALRVTDLHRKLYHAFPSARGVSFRGKDYAALPAIIVMAIAQTQIRTSTKDTVLIYTPKLCEKWALNGLEQAARRVMRCKKEGESRGMFVRDMFGRVFVSHRFLGTQEPDGWVAIGLCRDAPLPDWLRNKLIEVPRG
jgi:hypothetical protein